MGSVKVTVFGRIKPSDKPTQEYKLNYENQEDVITFSNCRTLGKKSFRFKKIFDKNATQEHIFETVAKPVINNIFLGYNGTIFTYGQTGSGKTYTMTGDLENYLNSGLIPRTVHEIFKIKGQDTIITITFCEIYNEHIYDLIRVDQMESDLDPISSLEVNTGATHFRNLSAHKVRTSSEAMELFLRGDANKMVAETNNNARSSRSHVIFSISLELPHPTQENLSLKPILYLVDLAGSEKASKSKTPLSNPCETRYINLSLHYLEQVLIALRQPGRVHIPYRNSLMTALLRNSLGGNCITAMIATFSVALNDADETLQTCRFAERIALIKNEIKLTESSSPEKEIYLLKKENERLKAQIKLMNNEQVTEKLSEEDKQKCAEIVYRFIEDNDYFELPLSNIRRMEYCFRIMREEILKNLSSRKTENEKNGKNESAQGLKERLRQDIVCEIQEERLYENQLKNLPKSTKKEQNLFKLTKSSIESQVQSNLTQESCAMCAKKNVRKNRVILDLPKIDITFKRSSSTGQLIEKENKAPKNESHTEVDITEVNYLNYDGFEDLTSKDSMKLHKHNLVTQTFLTRNNSVNFIKEKGTIRRKTSIAGLKLSNETKTESKNFIDTSNGFLKPNAPHVGIKSDTSKPDFLRSIISETVKNLSDENGYCSNSKAHENVEKGITMTENTDSENNSFDKIFDHLNLNLNNLNELSAIGVPLTGDKEVDEEILKFYKSRYQLYKNK